MLSLSSSLIKMYSSLLLLFIFMTLTMSRSTHYRAPVVIPEYLDPIDSYYDASYNDYQMPEEKYSDQDAEAEWAQLIALNELVGNVAYGGLREDKEKPVWGHIIREEPKKPEIELEELKKLYKNGNTKRSSIISTTQSPSSKGIKSDSTSLKTDLKNAKTLQSEKMNGQKEIPLLRPPAQLSQTENSLKVSQRSLHQSPYDTLRKYLSIEDAIKKENEKRSGGGKESSKRQVKRSFIVADENTLKGQLSNLKGVYT